jgi:hypothetical protein
MRHPDRPGRLCALAEVKYAICCPSFDERWLTGFEFFEPLEDRELPPYAS